MIRFEHISGSMAGKAYESPKAIVKIGRDPKSDIAFDPFKDKLVSTNHAEVRYNGAGYELVDLNSSNGTFINEKKVSGSRKLKDGDVIMFGAGGPTMRFLVMPDNAMPAPMQRAQPQPQYQGPVPKTARGQAHVSAAPQMQQPMYQPPMAPPQHTGKSKAMEDLAAEAQMKIAMARAAKGGGPSGQTMFLMVETLEKGVKKSRKKYLWLVAILLVVAGGFGVVAYRRGLELDKLKSKKTGLAEQIKKLQMQMEMGIANEDQIKQLQELLGQAKATDQQLEKKGVKSVGATGDFVTDELQKLLAKFDQENYAIPPIFRDTVKKHIEATIKRSNFKLVYDRRNRYWPLVQKEFGKRGIPEEMGYVAWTESQFDPSAESGVGAKGMWQFMAPTARRYGLRVDDKVDERLDPSKLTPAAAKYLGDLLAEFGDLMLAIASYNKGEEGMRRVLRQYGFWRKEQRNFWHLYYLHLLPEETLQYVPQILAAAIICSNPEKYGLPR